MRRRGELHDLGQADLGSFALSSNMTWKAVGEAERWLVHGTSWVVSWNTAPAGGFWGNREAGWQKLSLIL